MNELRKLLALPRRCARKSVRVASRLASQIRYGSLPTHDFNILLHELRARQLRQMPRGARTVLSGGCSDAYYFRWFKDNYPDVERHIGLEYYAPQPTDLPPNVQWIKNTMGNMSGVPSGSIDMVFAGQVIEHVWPHDVAGFLTEAYRVLRPDGWLVLDSPNRRLTHALGWQHPQHTAEFTVDEIVELLTVAGFEQIHVRGLWLCYDRKGHRVLSLFPDPGSWEWSPARRAHAGIRSPEDCFVWWAEARKGPRQPDRARLQTRAKEIYDQARPVSLARLHHQIGTITGFARDKWVTCHQGEAGYLMFGPSVPLTPGHYEAKFLLGCADGGVPHDVEGTEVAAIFDIVGESGQFTAVRHEVTLNDLRSGAMNEYCLNFHLADTLFGAEFRVQSTGRVALRARFWADVHERN